MTTKRTITAALLALGATAALVPALASGERSVDYPELEGPFLIGSELDGANVVPGPGSASGSATLGIDTHISQRRICYRIKTDGLDAVTGAYIHKGEPGAAGPVRITLLEETEGRAEADYYEGCVAHVKKRLIKG